MSSFTYPNVLVKDYLKKTGKLTPKIEMTADGYINQGYQTLLNYEIKSTGGFDWHGNPPANIILSAYGLLEFTDMAKVFDVDTRVIERAQKFVLSKQASDGSWDLDGGRTAWSWRGLQGKAIVTAYVAWGMAESGYTGEPLNRAIRWLKTNGSEAEKDTYGLALMANAFVAWDPKDDATIAVVKKLDDMKKQDSIDGTAVCSWQGVQTLYYAKGQSADIEATALAAYAVLKSGSFPTTAQQALNYLMKTKQGNGTWGSTSATILAFKALLRGMSGVEQKTAVNVTVDLNGAPRTVTIAPDQSDVLQLFDLRETTRKGRNDLRIAVAGENNMMYQTVTRYYLPWSDVAAERKTVDIALTYDRTNLKVDDTVKADVKVTYNGTQSTFMVLVTLGIAPGFTVDAGDFAELLGAKKIDRYELTARQARVYLGTMNPGQTFAFSYRLKAKYPVKAKAPKSEVYEYYTPANRAEAKPVELEVTEK